MQNAKNMINNICVKFIVFGSILYKIEDNRPRNNEPRRNAF